jgi:hypothetical protein
MITEPKTLKRNSVQGRTTAPQQLFQDPLQGFAIETVQDLQSSVVAWLKFVDVSPKREEFRFRTMALCGAAGSGTELDLDAIQYREDYGSSTVV